MCVCVSGDGVCAVGVCVCVCVCVSGDGACAVGVCVCLR